MSFFNVQKYPPSLLFVAVTVGIGLVLLPLAERRHPPFYGALVTFGRVPLFFYVAHLYLAHLLALIVGVWRGFPLEAWLTLPFQKPDGAGFGLWGVYGFWLVIVLALYPVCRWFARRKAAGQGWWWSYL